MTPAIFHDIFTFLLLSIQYPLRNHFVVLQIYTYAIKKRTLRWEQYCFALLDWFTSGDDKNGTEAIIRRIADMIWSFHEMSNEVGKGLDGSMRPRWGLRHRFAWMEMQSSRAHQNGIRFHRNWYVFSLGERLDLNCCGSCGRVAWRTNDVGIEFGFQFNALEFEFFFFPFFFYLLSAKSNGFFYRKKDSLY